MSGLSGQPFFYFRHHLPNIRIAGALLESSFSPIFTFTVDTILVLLDLLTYLLTQSPSNLSHYAIPPRPQLHSSPVPSFHNLLTSSFSCISSSCPLWSDPTKSKQAEQEIPFRCIFSTSPPIHPITPHLRPPFAAQSGRASTPSFPRGLPGDFFCRPKKQKKNGRGEGVCIIVL
ncbi:hypothetical protein M431DRAFT_298022 [Trichoderma harzianum CBS 226.95]|uniref:Uncharacterized protein n=1 Tax=Trichoderma harzianum CBS 226.95 TaxID=983964 RepID=A0A2T4AQA5_TRIHA|nr:hypothetical protein M431DRAFT_298022 [Trichoderma harzianum CBS 226.95]PTB59230.1 hypothetical protein M431DRAFT_298022 [Trichoderma harzianum CBS 226.95]